VLYVDGEMAREDLQARARRFGGDDVSSLPLHFMARDLYPDGMPTLNVDKVKDAIEEAARIQDAKLIVLDNLSTLWRGSENEAEAWDGMQDWLFRLRRAGRSVLIVHHSGKNGSQRGSSRKEDTLDVVVALRRPSSSDSTNGAAFNVHFEKTRQCFGQAAAPFHAALDEASLSGIDGWVRTAVKIDTMIDEMDAMRKDGKTLEQIGQRFGIDKSTVSRKLRLVPVPEASSPPPEVAGDSREVPDGGNP
jgi:hypothetical protein